jgi:hypothetical protein
MFQPRRLRTRSGPSVETIARKPSHLTSWSRSRGSEDTRSASMGSGSALYGTAAVAETLFPVSDRETRSGRVTGHSRSPS